MAPASSLQRQEIAGEIYRLAANALTETRVGVLPGLTIRWDHLVARLPDPMI